MRNIIKRWGITPLQIFLHKDEGHWIGGEPAPDDKESFQIGGRWFKPNYHAHIVFDWMDHNTGKSRKLNDDDMMQMQTLASEILSMERGQSKTETGKEHLERNDFIIEKQRAELERIEGERQHKEHQIDLAEQELKTGEIWDTHRQTQKRSHRCSHSPCKRSEFSFRQR